MVSPLAQALTYQQPLIQPARQPIANTDVVSAYRDAQNQAMAVYQAQLQRQNAMWGGLAGLGSAGILAGPRLYQLLNPAATAASTAATAAPAATTAANALGTGGTAAMDAALGGTSVADLAGVGAGGTALADLAGTGAATTAGADLMAAAAPAATDAAASFSLADLLPLLALA